MSNVHLFLSSALSHRSLAWLQVGGGRQFMREITMVSLPDANPAAALSLSLSLFVVKLLQWHNARFRVLITFCKKKQLFSATEYVAVALQI
jgi:hypothetical protein